MRLPKITTKNFLKLAVLQLALLGILIVAVPPVSTYAAPAKDNAKQQQDDAKKAAAKKKQQNKAPTANQSGINSGNLPTVGANTGTIQTVLRIVFGIIGAFAVLNITLSGFKYITAAGNEQQVSEAKNGIVYSVVGLSVAIAAEAIVAFVVHWTS